MKYCFIFLSFHLFVFFSPVKAEEKPCSLSDALPEKVTTLTKDLEKISDGLYKDLAKVKVEHDGEGKLSVYYENGVPKILKFTYKNKKGSAVIQKTFEELENGEKLIYENPDKPGPAISLGKGPKFKIDNSYNFILTTRKEMKPVSYSSYPFELRGDEKNPQLTANKKQCMNITFSPGVTFTLSWDGTFEKVAFQ